MSFVFQEVDFLCSPENGLSESGEDKIDPFLSSSEEMTVTWKRWWWWKLREQIISKDIYEVKSDKIRSKSVEATS